MIKSEWRVFCKFFVILSINKVTVVAQRGASRSSVWVTVVAQWGDGPSSVWVTVVAQWAKAPGIHCYDAGSIPAVTPRYCTKKIEKMLFRAKKTKGKKLTRCMPLAFNH
jgi:hypothetical protein